MPTPDHRALYYVLAALPLTALPAVRQFIADLWVSQPIDGITATKDRKVSGE